MISTYLNNLTKVLGIGAAFAALPFFASLASLQPPWPPAIGFVSSALVLLAALATWEFARSARVRNRRAWLVLSAVVTLAGLAIYLVFYSLFIEVIPGSDVRVIRGYVCTPLALEAYGAECPDLPAQALRDSEWESTVLWTRQSVTVIRLSLAGAWLLFTSGLIAAVGTIVAGRKY